jgi:hypothetical protein
MSANKPLKKLEKEVETESEDQLLALDPAWPPRELMAGAAVQLTAPAKYLPEEKRHRMLANAALDLYCDLAPSDATETLLSMLAVSVANASVDCLTQAALARPEWLEGRDLNLRHGLKGAAVAAELIKVLDARRGIGPKKVTVGSVNVEAGGQAIVGNVESRRMSDNSEPSGSEVIVHSSTPEALGS